ncbi:MAG: hypothetical protein ACXWKP_24385 [Bradyrhizobium sp.]
MFFNCSVLEKGLISVATGLKNIVIYAARLALAARRDVEVSCQFPLPQREGAASLSSQRRPGVAAAVEMLQKPPRKMADDPAASDP